VWQNETACAAAVAHGLFRSRGSCLFGTNDRKAERRLSPCSRAIRPASALPHADGWRRENVVGLAARTNDYSDIIGAIARKKLAR